MSILSQRPTRILLSVLLLGPLLLAGCSTFPSGGAPLADSTFSKVLVDLHLVTARTNHHGTRSPGLRDSVFAQHDVRRSEFEATLQYYSERPDAFESLYKGVLDTLNAVESNLRQGPRSYQNRPDDPRNRTGESTYGVP